MVLRMSVPCARFKPGTEVADPARLFGRDSALRSLGAALRAGTHTEVVAERKFGKSSLLRCAAPLFKDDERFLAVYVPVNYLNCSAWPHFYGWLTAHTLASAAKRAPAAHLCAATKFGSKCLGTYSSDPDPYEIFARLPQQSEKMLSSFQFLFTHLAEVGISTILLLDEISSALKYFDGDSEQFRYLRQMAMEQGASGCQVLTICTADRAEWQDIISKAAGSPGLNFISNHLRLGSIPEYDARGLLQAHAKECEPPFDMPPGISDAVLDLAQAYPYYLKVAAEKAYQQVVPSGRHDSALLWEQTYAAVRGHLLRYISSCNTAEKKALRTVISSPVSSQQKNVPLDRLFRRGLLEIDGGLFKPFNSLFRMACEEVL